MRTAFRVFLVCTGCLALLTVVSALAVLMEAAPDGLPRVCAWGVGLLVYPVLEMLGELVPSPIEVIARLPWIETASPLIRIAIGVLVTLPFFAFGIGASWLLHRWMGVPGW